MKGNMMSWDLILPRIILHAEDYDFDGKLVLRELVGSKNALSAKKTFLKRTFNSPMYSYSTHEYIEYITYSYSPSGLLN